MDPPTQALLVLLLLLVPISATPFLPSDNHLITAGESAAVLPDGRLFSPDSSFLSSAAGGLVRLSSSSTNPSLYRTARVFHGPASYTFPISRPGAHLLRFHFYPSADLSGALFYVAASGFSLLANYSAALPVIEEFIVPVDAHKLIVSFYPAHGSAFAFVNAIEVLSAPEGLIVDVATSVTPDGPQRFEGLSLQVLETIHRVNVGGSMVTPFNDTLWRTWIPDNGYFTSDTSGSKTVVFTGRIHYSKDGASREVVPDNVCSSARVLESNRAKLSWRFPVSAHNRYLVRMFFCDIASKALGNLYFDVYLNGYLGAKDVDLSTIGLAAPYYVDFIVDAGNSSVLDLVCSPSTMSGDSSVQGLLNGLEIMRMNRTSTGMDAALPVSVVEVSAVSKGFGEFFRAVLCGAAFVTLVAILFLLILLLRVEWRKAIGWSLLPSDVTNGKSGEGQHLAPGKIEF